MERLPPPLDDQGDEYQYYDQGQPYGEEMSTHTEMMDRHGTTEGYDRNPFQMSLAELKANKVEDDKAHN